MSSKLEEEFKKVGFGHNLFERKRDTQKSPLLRVINKKKIEEIKKNVGDDLGLDNKKDDNGSESKELLKIKEFTGGIFEELNDKYHINIPKIDCKIEEDSDGNEVLHQHIERVSGDVMDEYFSDKLKTEDVASKTKGVLNSFINYFTDKLKNNGYYLFNIKNDDFMFGSTSDNSDQKIYLVDTDPSIKRMDQKSFNWSLADITIISSEWEEILKTDFSEIKNRIKGLANEMRKKSSGDSENKPLDIIDEYLSE